MSELHEVISTTKDFILGNKVIKVGKLVLKDYAQFQNWIVEKKKIEYVENCKLAEEKISIKDINSIKLEQNDIDNYLNNIEGMSYIIQRIFLRYNDLSLSEIDNLLSMGELNIISDIISYSFSGIEENVDTEEKVEEEDKKKLTGETVSP
jgi:hypothetical protein